MTIPAFMKDSEIWKEDDFHQKREIIWNIWEIREEKETERKRGERGKGRDVGRWRVGLVTKLMPGID